VNLFSLLGGSSRGGTRISPTILAVLGVLAYRTLKGKGRLADLLGTGPAGTAGNPSGPSGAEWSGGLADLLARFRPKHENTAQSWVSKGPNRSVDPSELEEVLGEERIQWLVEQTGTSKDELLAGLSKALPEAVDKLTPDGRIPTADELERLG
jgi:uncharacterized protein YidB (DUF937 family)